MDCTTASQPPAPTELLRLPPGLLCSAQPTQVKEFRALEAVITTPSQVVDAFAGIAYFNNRPLASNDLLRPIYTSIENPAPGQGTLKKHKVYFSNAACALDGPWEYMVPGSTRRIEGCDLSFCVIRHRPGGGDVLHNTLHHIETSYTVRDAQATAVGLLAEGFDLSLDYNDPIFQGAVRESLSSFLAQACRLPGMSMRRVVTPLLSAAPPRKRMPPPPRTAKVVPFERPPYLPGPAWLCEAFGTSLNLEGDNRATPAKSLWFTQIYEGVHY